MAFLVLCPSWGRRVAHVFPTDHPDPMPYVSHTVCLLSSRRPSVPLEALGRWFMSPCLCLEHIPPIGKVCPDTYTHTPPCPFHVEHGADWEPASWVEDADYCSRRCVRGQVVCAPWLPRLYAGMAGMALHLYQLEWFRPPSLQLVWLFGG